MSNGLAIAAITAVLKNLLEDGLVQNSALSSMGNVKLTTLPPDKVSVEVDGQPQLNLFLYQVTQNRNADWIGRDRPHHLRLDTIDENPPLAINLHYLITVYGTKDFQAELLLGCAMELMHQSPVLSNDEIQASLKHTASINRDGVFSQAIASTSLPSLTEQIGQVQITPNMLDIEKMSRLWSFLKGSYQPSITYEVSMILIGNQKSSLTTNPTLEVGCPHIQKVVASLTGSSIVAGSSLLIYGRNLEGDVTRIRLNGGQTLLEPEIVEDHRLLFKLPRNLQAGVQKIQVVHQPLYKFKNSQEVESNKQSFVLHPTIVVSFCEVKAGVAQQQSDRSQSEEKILHVEFNPKIGQQQQVIFKLTSANGSDEIYTFEAPPRESDTDIIQIPIDNVPASKYYVQVQVDGVENLSEMNEIDNAIHVVEHSKPGDPLEVE